MAYANKSSLLTPISLGWGITNKRQPMRSQTFHGTQASHMNASPMPASPRPCLASPQQRGSPMGMVSLSNAAVTPVRTISQASESVSAQNGALLRAQSPMRALTANRTFTSGDGGTAQVRARSPMGFHSARIGTVAPAQRMSLPHGGAGAQASGMGARSVGAGASAGTAQISSVGAYARHTISEPVKTEDSPRDTVWKRLFENRPQNEPLHAISYSHPEQMASPAQRDGFTQGRSLPSDHDLDVTYPNSASNERYPSDAGGKNNGNAPQFGYKVTNPYSPQERRTGSPTGIQHVAPLQSTPQYGNTDSVTERRMPQRSQPPQTRSPAPRSPQPQQSRSPLPQSRSPLPQSREAYPPSPGDIAFAERQERQAQQGQPSSSRSGPQSRLGYDGNVYSRENAEIANGRAYASSAGATKNYEESNAKMDTSYDNGPTDDLTNMMKALKDAKDEHLRFARANREQEEGIREQYSPPTTSDAPTTYINYLHAPSTRDNYGQPTSSARESYAGQPSVNSARESDTAHSTFQTSSTSNSILAPGTQSQRSPDQRQSTQPMSERTSHSSTREQQPRSMTSAPPPMANSRQITNTLESKTSVSDLRKTESRNSVGSEPRMTVQKTSSLTDSRAKILRDVQRERSLKELTADITRHRIRELRSFQRPHELVQKVVRMFVSLVTNRDVTLENWATLKKTLGVSSFLDTVAQFDVNRLSPATREILQQHYEQGALDANLLVDVSPSIIPFSRWCEAVAKLSEARLRPNGQDTAQVDHSPVEQYTQHPEPYGSHAPAQYTTHNEQYSPQQPDRYIAQHQDPYSAQQQDPYIAPQPNTYSAQQPNSYTAQQPNSYTIQQQDPFSAQQTNTYSAQRDQQYGSPYSVQYGAQQNEQYDAQYDAMQKEQYGVKAERDTNYSAQPPTQLNPTELDAHYGAPPTQLNVSAGHNAGFNEQPPQLNISTDYDAHYHAQPPTQLNVSTEPDTMEAGQFSPNFILAPEIEKLSESELANVYLVVEVPFVGKIEFAQAVDLRGWTRADIRRNIQLDVGEVVVYPDVKDKPPVGVGLNRPATITLYQCYPPKQQDQMIKSSEARARYERKIQRMTEQKGARFISYDPTEGEWIFAVDHF